jgi:hypothetical protein
MPPYSSGMGSSIAPTSYLDRLGEVEGVGETLAAWPAELQKALAMFRAGFSGDAPSAIQRATTPKAPPIGDMLTQEERNAQAEAAKAYTASQAAPSGPPGTGGAVPSRNPGTLGMGAPSVPPMSLEDTQRGTLMFSLGRDQPLRAYDPTFSYDTFGSTRMGRLGLAGPPEPRETGAEPMSGANGPSVSFIEGTPEQRARLATEEAMRSRDLNRARAEASAYEVPTGDSQMPNPIGLTRAQLAEAIIAAARVRPDTDMQKLQYGQQIARAARTELEVVLNQVLKMNLDPATRQVKEQEAIARWKALWGPQLDALGMTEGVRPLPQYDR